MRAPGRGRADARSPVMFSASALERRRPALFPPGRESEAGRFPVSVNPAERSGGGATYEGSRTRKGERKIAGDHQCAQASPDAGAGAQDLQLRPVRPCGSGGDAPGPRAEEARLSTPGRESEGARSPVVISATERSGGRATYDSARRAWGAGRICPRLARPSIAPALLFRIRSPCEIPDPHPRRARPPTCGTAADAEARKAERASIAI
jgi:hypothetical protein